MTAKIHIKRTVRVGGRSTSITLPPADWIAFAALAQRRAMTTPELLSDLRARAVAHAGDDQRVNLSETARAYVARNRRRLG